MPTTMFDCVFRADGGPGFGFGHLRRCFILAEALKREGVKKIAFISKTKAAAEKVLKKRFPIIEIPRQKNEISFFRNYFSSSKSRLLILDSYKISRKTVAVYRKFFPVVMFDDLGNLWPNYAVDGIINYHVYARKIKYRCLNNTRLLTGSQYVLIEPSLNKLVSKRTTSKPKRFFVTLSGTPPPECSRKILRVLKWLRGPLKVDIPTTLVHNRVPQKNDVCVNLLSFQQINRVLAKTDFALCAAGLISYELIFLGIPFLTTVIAKHHELAAVWLDKLGAAKNIGWFVKLKDHKIADEIEHFIRDEHARKEMSRKQRRLIDGFGNKRLAKQVIRYWIGNKK